MDRNLSPVEDTERASRFWLRCVDCGGAVATAVTPEISSSVATLARPFLKMLAIKLDLPADVRAQVTGENPLSILGDSELVPALFALRCPDCTVKHGYVSV